MTEKKTTEKSPGSSPSKPSGKVPDYLGDDVKPKRGHYRQKECPYCHIHVGNLGNHIKLKHPAEAAAAPPADVTKEDLLGQAKRKDPPPQPGDTFYYCQDCKAELRKGEASCWKCGTVLDWSAVE